ncbi:MAG: IS1595 family transposase, partial [Candidatus Omnitrophica bacterium]|nr:IS1595 family transposase [Candidatus Omnitrophota bacterium]
MSKTFTIQEFFKRFPNDDACLAHLMKVRYGAEIVCPKCKKHGKFHKIKKMPAYSCQWCGNHVHPMVGTPFEKSRTPLQKWFYAMYLFTTSRHGVPAKELQRQLGVTYKCAWRMAHQIRLYMGKVDGDEPLDGHVEVDETLIGPKRVKGGKKGMSAKNKTIVMGLVERDGKVITRIVKSVRRDDLIPIIRASI